MVLRDNTHSYYFLNCAWIPVDFPTGETEGRARAFEVVESPEANPRAPFHHEFIRTLMKFKAVVTPLQRWHNDNEQDDDHEDDGNDGRRRDATSRIVYDTFGHPHASFRCSMFYL